YTSTAFRGALMAFGLRGSMGRVGSCYDNAAAESWFATLKRELEHTVFARRDEASRGVRLHQLLQPPAAAFQPRLPHTTRSRAALPSPTTAGRMKTRCPPKRGN